MLTTINTKFRIMISRSSFLSRGQLNQRLAQQRWKTYPAPLERKSDLNHAVSEAEKIVGYPTSFLNLRWLLTDELANVALHFRRLIGSNHPLLDTARKLFLGNSLPAWGLLVLLISKTGGLNSNFSENTRDLTAGVLHSQRALAEVTEMIRTSNLIHKSVTNIADEVKNEILELNFGNKVALLSGDHLLSKSFHELACLRNQNLNELMSSALRDLVDAEFMGLRDKQDVALPCKPVKLHEITIADQFGTEAYNVNEVLGNPHAEWTLRNVLGGASLLGKSCQGALLLAEHSEDVQKLGYLFGKNTALAWQAQVEQEAFAPDSSGTFSLVSAPVMLHLQHDPSLYTQIEKGKDDVLNIDFEDLRKTIQNGPGLESTKNLQKVHASNALDVLSRLPASDARGALENIINTLL